MRAVEGSSSNPKLRNLLHHLAPAGLGQQSLAVLGDDLQEQTFPDVSEVELSSRQILKKSNCHSIFSSQPLCLRQMKM